MDIEMLLQAHEGAMQVSGFPPDPAVEERVLGAFREAWAALEVQVTEDMVGAMLVGLMVLPVLVARQMGIESEEDFERQWKLVHGAVGFQLGEILKGLVEQRTEMLDPMMGDDG